MNDRDISLTPAAPSKALRARLYDGTLLLTETGPRGGYYPVTVPRSEVPALVELITPKPATDEQRVDRALALLVEARELLTIADNKRTVARVRAAISSCKGARRIQTSRRVRAELLAAASTECGQCEGTGTTDAMGYPEECPVCDGSGQLP